MYYSSVNITTGEIISRPCVHDADNVLGVVVGVL
jgi:hypothetical protein